MIVVFLVLEWDIFMSVVCIQYSNNIPIVMMMTCGVFGYIQLHMVFLFFWCGGCACT